MSTITRDAIKVVVDGSDDGRFVFVDFKPDGRKPLGQTLPTSDEGWKNIRRWVLAQDVPDWAMIFAFRELEHLERPLEHRYWAAVRKANRERELAARQAREARIRDGIGFAIYVGFCGALCLTVYWLLQEWGA